MFERLNPYGSEQVKPAAWLWIQKGPASQRHHEGEPYSKVLLVMVLLLPQIGGHIVEEARCGIRLKDGPQPLAEPRLHDSDQVHVVADLSLKFLGNVSQSRCVTRLRRLKVAQGIDSSSAGANLESGVWDFDTQSREVNDKTHPQDGATA